MDHSNSTRITPLVETLERTLDRHGMLDGCRSVLAGVSGGADSVCLVRALAVLAGQESRQGLRIGIAHVNHGWRGAESDRDERFVQDLAGTLGLECFVLRQGEPGAGNAEAVARQTRRRFFEEVRVRGDFDRIALAHTRNDRNETFLLNLLRGSGTRGLAAMRPVNGPIIRPLVETDRAGVVAWLDAIGQEWREDPTNQDRRFARNRIRHDVLPMLARNSNPNLDATLARTIDLLEDEDVWMDQMAGQWLGPRVALDGPELVVRIDDLTTRGPAMVRRILRQALRMAGSGMENIGFDHIESVRSLLETGKSGRTIELPGAFSVERSFDTLRMVPDRPRVGDYEYELPIPGRIEVREIGRVFRATLVEPNAPKTDKPNANRVFVDGASLGPCVKIRNWKIGDSYEPDGLSASKLKMLFQKEHIPRRKRLEWPVLVAETSIVWVASFPVSRDFVPNRRSRKIVEFEASRL